MFFYTLYHGIHHHFAPPFGIIFVFFSNHHWWPSKTKSRETPNSWWMIYVGTSTWNYFNFRYIRSGCWGTFHWYTEKKRKSNIVLLHNGTLTTGTPKWGGLEWKMVPSHRLGSHKQPLGQHNLGHQSGALCLHNFPRRKHPSRNTDPEAPPVADQVDVWSQSPISIQSCLWARVWSTFGVLIALGWEMAHQNNFSFPMAPCSRLPEYRQRWHVEGSACGVGAGLACKFILSHPMYDVIHGKSSSCSLQVWFPIVNVVIFRFQSFIFGGVEPRRLKNVTAWWLTPPPHSDRCDSETPPLQSWGRKIHDSNKHYIRHPSCVHIPNSARGTHYMYLSDGKWIRLWLTSGWIGGFLNQSSFWFGKISRRHQATLFLGLFFFFRSQTSNHQRLSGNFSLNIKHANPSFMDDWRHDYISLPKRKTQNLHGFPRCFPPSTSPWNAELLTVLAMSLDYSVLRPNDGPLDAWIHMDPVDHGNPRGPPSQCRDSTPGNSWSYQRRVKILSKKNHAWVILPC